MAARWSSTEQQEQRAICELLKAIGAAVYVIGVHRKKGDHPGTMQTPGIPDLYAFLPRRLGSKHAIFAPAIWIEVKRVNGRTADPQLGFEVRCADANHRYFRGTADEFAKYLRRLGLLK